MSEVADLLSRSLALHAQAKPVMAGTGSNRRVIRERDMVKLAEACALRKQAVALDPEYTDPAWTTGPEHRALMDFYKDLDLA